MPKIEGGWGRGGGGGGGGTKVERYSVPSLSRLATSSPAWFVLREFASIVTVPTGTLCSIIVCGPVAAKAVSIDPSLTLSKTECVYHHWVCPGWCFECGLQIGD